MLTLIQVVSEMEHDTAVEVKEGSTPLIFTRAKNLVDYGKHRHNLLVKKVTKKTRYGIDYTEIEV